MLNVNTRPVLGSPFVCACRLSCNKAEKGTMNFGVKLPLIICTSNRKYWVHHAGGEGARQQSLTVSGRLIGHWLRHISPVAKKKSKLKEKATKGTSRYHTATVFLFRRNNVHYLSGSRSFMLQEILWTFWTSATIWSGKRRPETEVDHEA